MIILIPAYQPDEKLVDLLRLVKATDPDQVVVVVDDGSGPDYRRVFDGAQRLGAVVIGDNTNLGKGFALKAGFAFIAGEFPGHDVVCADCDGQHAIADIMRVGHHVQTSNADLVLGSRNFSGNVPLRSKFGNAMTRLLFRLSTGRRINDTQTGLRGYPASMLAWLQSVKGDRYEYELNLLLEACQSGRTIETVDIATIYLDENASSHFRPLADSARIYAPLLKFMVSSLAAFTIDTVALLALSAMTGSLLVAVVGARLLSSAANFAINRRAVFDHGREKPVGVAAAGYFALVVALLTVNYAMLLFLTALAVPLLVGKLLTETTLFAISYAVQTRFLFARSKSATIDDAGRDLPDGDANEPPTDIPSTARGIAA